MGMDMVAPPFTQGASLAESRRGNSENEAGNTSGMCSASLYKSYCTLSSYSFFVLFTRTFLFVCKLGCLNVFCCA